MVALNVSAAAAVFILLDPDRLQELKSRYSWYAAAIVELQHMMLAGYWIRIRLQEFASMLLVRGSDQWPAADLSSSQLLDPDPPTGAHIMLLVRGRDL